jgi:hypothetical protein
MCRQGTDMLNIIIPLFVVPLVVVDALLAWKIT